MEYRKEIDGLRAVAVVPVLLFHAGIAGFNGGFVGVDVFFVISGYLIGTIVWSEVSDDRFSLLSFYERRARRLLPALFLVLLLSSIAALFLMLPHELADYAKSLLAVLSFVSNFYFWRESGYFETTAELKPLLHTWSLAVEEQFYLFFPPLLLLLARWVKAWALWILSGLAVLSFLFSVLASARFPDLAFYLLPSRAWELLLGALVAVGWRERSFSERVRVGRPAQEVLALMGVLLIAASIVGLDKRDPFPGPYALLPCLGTLLVIVYAQAGTLVARVLSTRLLVFLGLISYSLYLFHQPLLAFLRHLVGDHPDPIQISCALLLSLLLAVVSWRYVERPFRQKQRFSRRRVFALSAAVTAVFAAYAVSGVLTSGYLKRFDAEDRGLLRAMINPGAYVDRRFARHEAKPFESQDGKPKILIVGDSYAKDLLNAVYEIGLSDELDISTHWISGMCGNLYLKRDFTERIRPGRRNWCMRNGWYEEPQLERQLREADAIWLASFWYPWQVELLPESVANLQADFSENVLVFGRKDFGGFDLQELLRLEAEERASLTARVPERFKPVYESLEASFEIEQHVAISSAFCISLNACRLFTREGEVVTFDGKHLTQAGALHLGQWLVQQTEIARYLEAGAQAKLSP